MAETMTKKELRKLKKIELLELMLAMRKELDSAWEKNTKLEERIRQLEAEGNARRQTEAEKEMNIMMQKLEDAVREKIEKIKQDVEEKGKDNQKASENAGKHA